MLATARLPASHAFVDDTPIITVPTESQMQTSAVALDSHAAFRTGIATTVLVFSGYGFLASWMVCLHRNIESG